MIYCMSYSADDPWYRDGLRFMCTRCGNCCTGEPGYVWVNDEEIDAIADHRQEPRAEIVARFTKAGRRGRTLREKANGDCVFYDSKTGCTIYAIRPRQCRTWPFWDSNVNTPLAWDRTRALCPGAGKGELIPAEEISRRLKVIKL